ncbi:MAG: methylenetetrahydrofolate reductase [Promethearchaeota archaeon]
MPERPFSNLMRAIQEGKFVFTGELEPGKSANVQPVVEEALRLKRGGCVAGNVTQNPKADACISSLAASHLIQQRAEFEVVYQLTVRDFNRMALVSEILGAHALGLRNILALTGDHPACGDTPRSMPCYDLDSTHLVRLVREMVDQHSAFGQKLKKKWGAFPELHVGCAGNPNADPLEPEVLKIGRKAGYAEFMQTQVVYDVETAIRFCKAVEKYKIPILMGIFPMKNYPTAKGFDMYVPGVSVPTEVLDAFKEVHKGGYDEATKAKKYDELNVEFFAPLIQELKDKGLVAGIHVMAVQYARVIPMLMERLK